MFHYKELLILDLCVYKNDILGTSLVAQWLRFHAPSAVVLGLIPGQGIRFHMLQLKIPGASTRPGAAK